ncbi:MAG: DNA primase [Chitinophagales bacterium]
MITKDTIEKIRETARIEEVVGEFVQIKKRGVNYVGLCPFHNEKTPSFTVSATKGLYKCFGCGKGGDSIGFVMEHEHFTYREALKFLAAKYNIPIEEKVQTNEEIEAETKKESLYIVNAFAQNYFTNYLFNSEEGKTIGLSYFKERGLTEDTIQKFELGFCPSAGDAFTQDALKNSYQLAFLQQLGLTSQYKQDFFKGRVMFTIHSVSGKVLGFGGRTLSADKKIPKYINSPETEIYFKSKIVYGIYHARKPIAEKDECFLVEGYMDVISLHQAGIENVVASSGTSLTQDQVRLIKRYSKNLTIIYDGDSAGVKAALRGLDIALEEGMNVKVVLLPAEDDPDTLVRKLGMQGFLDFVTKEKKDIIHLKTSLFLEEAKGDPVKIADIIKDIVDSISKIPDAIVRSLYIKQTASTLHVEEQILISEINRILRKKTVDKLGAQDKASVEEHLQLPVARQTIRQEFKFHLDAEQEKDVVRLLLENSNYELDGENAIVKILRNLQDIEIENQLYTKVIEEYKSYYSQNEFISQGYFINHDDNAIKDLCLDLLTAPYELSANWEKMHGVHITDKFFLAGKDIVKTISLLKLKKIIKMKMEVDDRIRDLQQDDLHKNIDEIMMYQKEAMELQSYIKKLSADTGIVVMPVVK